MTHCLSEFFESFRRKLAFVSVSLGLDELFCLQCVSPSPVHCVWGVDYKCQRPKFPKQLQ